MPLDRIKTIFATLLASHREKRPSISAMAKQMHFRLSKLRATEKEATGATEVCDQIEAEGQWIRKMSLDDLKATAEVFKAFHASLPPNTSLISSAISEGEFGMPVPLFLADEEEVRDLFHVAWLASCRALEDYDEDNIKRRG